MVGISFHFFCLLPKVNFWKTDTEFFAGVWSWSTLTQLENKSMFFLAITKLASTFIRMSSIFIVCVLHCHWCTVSITYGYFFSSKKGKKRPFSSLKKKKKSDWIFAYLQGAMRVKLCIHLLLFLGRFWFKSKNYCFYEVPFSIKSKPHSSAQKASGIKELSRVFNRES